MSGAFAAGAAQGLSSGIERGRERRDKREAQDFRERVQEEQLEMQRRQFKLQQDDRKLKLDQIRKQRELTDQFFGLLGGNAGGAAQTVGIGRSPRPGATPSVSSGFVSDAEGRAAGRAAADLNPVPEQAVLKSQTPDLTPVDRIQIQQVRQDFTDPQRFNQIALLAQRAGQTDALDNLIEQGVVKPPPNHPKAIEQSLERLGLRKEQEEFNREKASRKALADLYVGMAESGDERGAAATAMLLTGNLERSAEIAFPNIEEPKTMFQAFLRANNGDPNKAAKQMQAANARPTEASLALAAANGDQKAAEALNNLADFKKRSARQRTTSFDAKTGTFTIEEGGIGGQAVQNKAIQKIQSINTTTALIDNFIEEADASGGKALGPEAVTRSIEQMAGDALITVRGMTGGDEFTQKLFDNFKTGDISSLETQHDIIAAKIGNDLLAEGGVLTEPDFQKAKQMIGGNTKSLMTNPAEFRARLESVKKTLQAQAEGNASVLDTQTRDRLLGGRRAAVPQQQRQPQNSARPTAPEGTQTVPSQQPQAQPQQQQPITIDTLDINDINNLPPEEVDRLLREVQ